MEKEEFEALRKVIKAYNDKKKVVVEKVREIEKKAREDWMFGINAELVIHKLYEELKETKESEAFSEAYKKTKTDDEYEKYFRSAALEIFLGIEISPENL